MGERGVTRVRQKNSRGLRARKSPAAEGGAGSPVEPSIENGALLVRFARRRSLDELLARLTKSRLQGEIDSGAPVGREVW